MRIPHCTWREGLLPAPPDPDPEFLALPTEEQVAHLYHQVQHLNGLVMPDGN